MLQPWSFIYELVIAQKNWNFYWSMSNCHTFKAINNGSVCSVLLLSTTRLFSACRAPNNPEMLQNSTEHTESLFITFRQLHDYGFWALPKTNQIMRILLKSVLNTIKYSTWFHITIMVPATLPVTCPKHIIFNGNTCPRYCRLSACSTGRDELSSTFQAIPVPQADKDIEWKHSSQVPPVSCR